MLPLASAVVLGSLVLAPPAAPAPGGSPPKAPAPAAEGFGAVRTPDLVRRVGGDRDIAISIDAGTYRCGRSLIESPLPDGYPEPTPPGAIDIKNYPVVRRAEWHSKGPTGSGMNVAFWPLFNHIKRHDIPMTSPVEMAYDGVWPDPSASIARNPLGTWSMSFLYRAPTVGQVGDDQGVQVVDAPAVTVVSIGVRGSYGIELAERGVGELRAWADAQREWELAGPVRVLHYNGPAVREAWKWSEVQIPVRKATPPATDAKGAGNR
jgi:hypothetical protein